MDELLSNTTAAQMLAERLPERSTEQWRLWLQNNRNQSRQAAYRVPFVRVGGGTFYALAELEKYVEFEQFRQLGKVKLSGRAAEALRAFGIGEQGGGALGRHFKGGSATPHLDNKSSAFVQAIIDEPFTVYAMTPEQAVAFGKELVEAGVAAQVINGTRQSQDGPSPAGIVDNADCRIERRNEK